jgi:hypothetical protein
VTEISLLHGAGVANIDQVLCQVVCTFEAAFPNRIRGYYVGGSYANGSHVPTSDLDLFIVFREAFAEGERARAERLGRHCARTSAAELELPITDEASLVGVNRMALKMDSALVYGEDVRDQIPLLQMADYVRQVSYRPLSYIGAVLRDSETLTFPVDYPDPQGVFYGYDREMGPYTGTRTRGTKWLVVNVCWIATALIAIQARQYVAGKSHCAHRYRECVGDKWTGLVSAIYERCKLRWAYRIPGDRDGRRQLKALCRQTLGFENHYLDVYREYLLERMQLGSNREKLYTARCLGEIIYPDEKVATALRAAALSSHEALRRTARKALQHMPSTLANASS